jgi:hypothetical protein
VLGGRNRETTSENPTIEGIHSSSLSSAGWGHGVEMPDCTARLPTEIYSPKSLSAISLRGLVAFTARCARRVQPLWGDLAESDRRELESAVQIAEAVGAGLRTNLDARRAEGVDLQRWSPRRPDFNIDKTASGAAIYSLVCACCESSEEAATPAVLAVREAHFAAGGDSADPREAEDHFRAGCAAPSGSILHLVALGIRRDLDCVAMITGRREGDPAVPARFFGPLWPTGAPADWPDE